MDFVASYWFELYVHERFDNHDLYIGEYRVLRDITDRKQTEAILQNTLNSLKKAVSMNIQALIDPHTAGHQRLTANLARSIATDTRLPPETIEGIRMGGYTHDFGKLSIPSELLYKPGTLSEKKFALIKDHSPSGYEILKDVESPWPLAEMIYQHHERIDGSGYPRKLKEDEIIIEARILGVSEVVEAMSSHRPCRPSLGIELALTEIEKNRGIFFDDTAVDA